MRSSKTMHELIGIQTQGENPIGEQPAHFFKMLGKTVPSGLALDVRNQTKKRNSQVKNLLIIVLLLLVVLEGYFLYNISKLTPYPGSEVYSLTYEQMTGNDWVGADYVVQLNRLTEFLLDLEEIGGRGNFGIAVDYDIEKLSNILKSSKNISPRPLGTIFASFVLGEKPEYGNVIKKWRSISIENN